MKYTKATNYALHIMAFMVNQESTENMSLQPLAKYLDMSPTYLSKILTQLVKANLIHSATGVNGGYSLRKNREEITFFDVVQAIEGSGALFTCEMNEAECHLQGVMREAEQRLESYLQSKTIYEVAKKSTPHGDCGP